MAAAGAMDALLRLSPALEARFWASPPVRAGLLRADRFAIWALLADNGMLTWALSLNAGSALPLQLGFFAILLFAQLAARRCAHQATWLPPTCHTTAAPARPAPPPPPVVCAVRCGRHY